MDIDMYGLPVDSGASTKADSARLAGMMSLVGHPDTPPLEDYFIGNMNPVRHPYAIVYPENNSRVMSRDQLICLAAGLHMQGNIVHSRRILDLCNWVAPNNMDEQTGKWKFPDLVSPSDYSHFRMCASYRSTFIGRRWFKFDLWVNGKFTPMKEQNQIQAKVLIAGPELVKLYVKLNPLWKEATRKYWVGDRISYCKGELELCEMIIKKIEEVAK